MTIRYNIKYTNINSSDSIENFLEEHMAKLDVVVEDSDTSAQAQIELEKTIPNQNNGHIYRAEINLHTAIGDFYVEETDSEIHAAIINMRDTIIRDVKKETQKSKDLSHKGAREMKDIIHKKN